MSTIAETGDALGDAPRVAPDVAAGLADRNRALVIRLMGALDSCDTDSLRAILSPDVNWHVQGVGSMDRDTLIAQLTAMLGSATSAHTAILATTAESERVAVESRGNFEFADGRAYRNHYHHLFTVRGDQVVGVTEYLDLRETERVFGPLGGGA